MTSLQDAPTSAEPDYRDVTRRAGWQDFRTLVGFMLVVAVALALSQVGEQTASGVATDLRLAFAGVPEGIATVLLWLVAGAYLALVVVSPAWLLLRRRFALLGRAVVGALAGLVGNAMLFRVPSVHVWMAALEASVPDLGTPQAREIAALAAITAVAGPAMSGRWSRALWSLLVVFALARVVSTSASPIGVLLAVGAGGMAGALALLLLGRTVPVLTTRGVRRVLTGCGVEVDDLVPGRGDGWDYRGQGASGPVLVRVVDDRDWRTEQVRRGLRRLRLRGVGDDDPYDSPVRAVAAEAMVGLLARVHGVRVADVLGVGQGAHGEGVLAVTDPGGTTLAALGDALTDDVLDAAWQEVCGLAAARIAVRELTTEHLVSLPDGVTVVDLGRAQPAAGDGVLAGDVAELLASTAALVGPERAVDVAYRVLGRERLTAALARLVPAALRPETRAAIKAHGGLAPLVARVSRVTGVDEPQFERLERFRPRTLVMAAMLGIAVYVLAPQLTDLSKLAQTVQEVDWRWVVPLVLASAATYLGAALGLAGGTPGRVPVGQAAGVALASSFVASFSPPGIGQVGLNVRFLQKRGFPTAIAASASAAKEVAVMIVHLSILTGFAIWAGSTDALSSELAQLPSPAVIAAMAGVLLSVVGVTFAIPRVRRLVTDRIVPAVRASAGAMREVVSTPTKVIALFGGVALLPMGYVVALYCAVRAFGVEPSFVAVGLVSLTVGALATAAPTPGGLGAVEGALLASLTGLGIHSESALAGVLLYRLATFWVPIAPGAVAFRVLGARDVL